MILMRYYANNNENTLPQCCYTHYEMRQEDLFAILLLRWDSFVINAYNLHCIRRRDVNKTYQIR